MHRFTFVVQVHTKGVSTLENLSTGERVRIAELSGVGPQIESWLTKLESGAEFEPGAGRGAQPEATA
jgi:hypothetical protein